MADHFTLPVMIRAMRLREQTMAMLRWTWRHKLRCLGSGLALVVGAYAVLFMLVSCAASPTNLQTATRDGRTLAYQRFAGGGDTGRLILVHGAPADASSWRHFVRQHAEGLPYAEVLVVDRLGYGNSSSTDELTLAGHAASLAPLLEVPGGSRAVLVGHSYGGPVVLRLAAEHPDAAGGIILAAGATDPGMKDSVWFRESVDAVSGVVPEPWARANRELLALTDENRAMRPMLTNVTCPVVVVHGTWDAVCPHDGTVAYLRGGLVNAESLEVVSLERVGHNVHLTHADVIAEHATALHAVAVRHIEE